MDETTGQETFKLPRRLPKQPNQVFYPEEPVPVPPRTKEFVAEEFVPVFEREPRSSASEWPEFPPQEFTATEEFHTSTLEFITEEAPVPPVPEFIIPAVDPLPPHPFFTPTEAPTVPPASAPVPRPHPVSPEPRSVREPSPSDSKPGIVPVGDPKPAFARPSGLSRSRPSRPSGNFPVARSSGAFPAAESSKDTFVRNEDKRSGGFATASVPTADAPPQFSGEVPPVGNFSHEASPSRIATSARKRRVSASTVPALIALSILLVGYSFAVGPIESSLESLLGGSAGPSSTLMTLVPWISLFPVILLLGGVFWIIAGLIGLRHGKPQARKARPADGKAGRKRKQERRKSPLELFREEAAQENIDGTAAYQAWRLLQPFGPDSHVLSVYDELEGTLGMRPKDIRSVYQQLVPVEHQEDRFHFRTVCDLLRMVKQASLSKT